jgi:cysteine desulfurase
MRAGMRLNGTIYLDYQASAPIDPVVLAAMETSWRQDFANPHAAEHSLGWAAHARIESAAAEIGATLGVGGDHIVFTSGATEANWLAIVGAVAGRGSAARRIVISAAEHKSVQNAAQHAAKRFGLGVETIGVDASGCVSAAVLQEVVAPDVALVSVIAVGNEAGAINDLAALRAAVGPEMLLHVDASQAPAAIGLGDIAQYADLVTLSSHKAYGPKGVGALVVSPDLQGHMQALMPGGSQQSGLRPGTLPTPLCVGFAAALTRMGALKDERVRIAELRDRFVASLARRCGAVSLVGASDARRHPGNACVRIEGVEAGDLLSALQPQIAASSQSACNSGTMSPSEVLLAMGLSPLAAGECVRFSLGRFTDAAQADEAADIVAGAIEGRRALPRPSRTAR